MKCSIFIAMSLDGFIAKEDGSVDWLHTVGNQDVDLGERSDMGMNDYMATVDCMIMGRKTMEVIAAMNLTPEQWPYGDTRIVVLSHTLSAPPANLRSKVELYAGDPQTLLARLGSEGYRHAYIDGGSTVQAFLKLQLIGEMTITVAPILLGRGIPLFAHGSRELTLQQSRVEAFPNDFVQLKYQVDYR